MGRGKNVKLEGFLTAIHCPSEELCYYTVDASHLPRGEFIKTVDELQDLIAEINEAYSKRKKTSRSLKTFHSRREYLEKGKSIVIRKRKIRFPIVPTTVTSTLNYTRQLAYVTLNKYGIIIQSIGSVAKRNLYLISFRKAPKFMNEISKLNEKIDEAEKTTATFMKSQYYIRLKRFVEQKFNTILPEEMGFSHIKVDLTPVSLSPKMVEELIEKKYKETFEKLKEEERRGIEEIRRELERKRRETVKKAILELDKKLRKIIINVVESSGIESIEKAKESIKEIEKIAEEIGLEAIAKTLTNKVVGIIEAIEGGNIEKAKELIKKEYNVDIGELRREELKEIPARIKSIIQFI